MFKKLIAFFGLFFLCGSSYCQKNMYRGYFVTNSGDTVSCFIQRISSEYNPTKFSYKTDSTLSDYKTKTIDEVKSFGIYGGDDYERYGAYITTSFTDLVNVGYDPESKKTYKTVFFKVYKFNRQIKFLVYKDKVKERFFLLEEKDTIPGELEYHIYRRSKESREVIKKETYKKQLEELVDKYIIYPNNAKERLIYIQYDEKLIVRFLDQVIGTDQDNTSKSSSQLKVVNKIKFRYYIAGGVNSYQYTAVKFYTGDFPKKGSKLTGSVNAGFDLLTDKIRNRFFIRVDLSLTPMGFLKQGSFTQLGQTVSVQRELKNNFALISPTFNFKVYDGYKTKLFTGIGIGYNLSLATRYTEKRSDIPNDNYFLQNGVYSGLHLQAGINALINNKIIISADYTAITLYKLYSANFIGIKVGWVFN